MMKPKPKILGHLDPQLRRRLRSVATLPPPNNIIIMMNTDKHPTRGARWQGAQPIMQRAVQHDVKLHMNSLMDGVTPTLTGGQERSMRPTC
jgi:hypothetical protein